MNRTASKKIFAIVAVVALVAILGVCLVACNKDSYKNRLEKAGYTVSAVDADDADYDEGKADWAVEGYKKGSSLFDLGEHVTVVKFKKEADAKDFEADIKGLVPLVVEKVERSGSIVIYGTEQGVKDAK